MTDEQANEIAKCILWLIASADREIAGEEAAAYTALVSALKELEQGYIVQAGKFIAQKNDAQREINTLLERVKELEDALCRISLDSKNSAGSREECGRIARAALTPKEKQ